MTIARVNHRQVSVFAQFFRAGTGSIRPFPFVDPDGTSRIFPPLGGEGVIDYFFFCCAHQFGFWLEADGRYREPMIAVVDGRKLKGSDYLWRCATRIWSRDQAAFTPERMQQTPLPDWDRAFHDDSGRNPLPLWEEHAEIIAHYTRWWTGTATTPAQVLDTANSSPRPLATFLQTAGRLPGYREDPLQKKLLLLAIALENRPEKFLRVTDTENWRPIIDYHLQRSALRTGLVEVVDAETTRRLRERQTVPASTEEAIRRTTYDAVEEVRRASGASIAAIDYFFFTNRTRCPEMDPPDCPACPVRSFCAKQVDLFQPVFRTAAY